MIPVPTGPGSGPAGEGRIGLPGSVLFCCTFNAVRSPMALGLLKRRFGTRVFADSCGLRGGFHAIDPMCLVVLDELGVDLSRHRPKLFADLEDSYFDLVISLTPEAHHRALELTRSSATQAEYWPTHDPTLTEGSREQCLEAYREVRDQLDKRIAARFTPD